MNELIASLKISLANVTLMYFKSHSYHWNVEGIHFNQLHSFFGELYTDVYDSVDPMAECIRKLDEYAPISLAELISYSTVQEDIHKPPTYSMMISNLITVNELVLESLNKSFNIATKNNEQGIANFLAERLDIHSKHAWQLKALSKG